MGWQSSRLIVVLVVALGAAAPGAQPTQSVSDAALLAEMKNQTAVIRLQMQAIKGMTESNDQIKTSLDALNLTVINQRSDLDTWRNSSVFLLQCCALCLGILWGMATWLLVVRSLERDSLL